MSIDSQYSARTLSDWVTGSYDKMCLGVHGEMKRVAFAELFTLGRFLSEQKFRTP